MTERMWNITLKELLKIMQSIIGKQSLEKYEATKITIVFNTL